MNIGLTYGKEQKLPTRMDNNQHTDSDVATELLVDDGDTCLATCTTPLLYASQYAELRAVQKPLKTSVLSKWAFVTDRARAIAAKPDTCRKSHSPQILIYPPHYLAELPQPTYPQDLQTPLKIPARRRKSHFPQILIYLPQYRAELLQPTYPQDLQTLLKTPVPSIRGFAAERARAIVARPDARPKSRAPQKSIYLPQTLAKSLQLTYPQDLQTPLKIPARHPPEIPGPPKDLQKLLKTPVLFIRGLAPERVRAIITKPDTRPKSRALQMSIYLPQYLAESLQPTYPRDFQNHLKMVVPLNRGPAPECARAMVAKPDTCLLAQSAAYFSAIRVRLQICL
ncbi:hypothetical protein K438DRAFT_1991119 [Mycena galopus ATCC 62051]|nr:hypothetical protein K438DRAFT_1991119 [Mycena galopus ATCC 62051]